MPPWGGQLWRRRMRRGGLGNGVTPGFPDTSLRYTGLPVIRGPLPTIPPSITCLRSRLDTMDTIVGLEK